VPYDRRPLKTRSLSIFRNLAKTLADRGVTPNQISIAGVLAAAAGFVCLWGAGRGWPYGWFFVLLAAVCVQIRLLCNLLDGIVAVELEKRQKGGDLFNEVPDRVEDTLFLVGAGYIAGSLTLGWLAAVLALFTAYIRALGASLGQAQDFGGPCAKPQRMAILTFGMVGSVLVYFLGLQLEIMKITLWVIIAGSALTAALRLRRLYNVLP
jgi:phosphatidylglycerophosphate synthase